MLLKQIHYFISIVDNNSFTEAAEECFISQSAISQQLKALELDLGVELLTRYNRKFVLTPAGEYFYKQSKNILSEIDKLKQETVNISRGNERHLKIGYLHCYGSKELSDTINTFSQKYPDVSIDLITGTHEYLYDHLRKGSVDMVLNDQRRALSDSYVNYHLITTNVFIEVSPRNPLSHKKQVYLPELQKATCILIAPQEQQEQEITYYKDTFGLGSSFLFANSPEEAHLMVVGNKGYTLTEGTHKKVSTQNTLAIPLFRGEKQATVKYYAFWQKERENPLVEEFANLLYQNFKHK